MIYLPTPVDGVCYDCDPSDPCAAGIACNECDPPLLAAYTATIDGVPYIYEWSAGCVWLYDGNASVYIDFNAPTHPNQWRMRKPGSSVRYNGPFTACDPTGEYWQTGYDSIWVS